MSETGYVMAFIVLSLFVIAILVVFVMASMGWFQRRSGGHEFPNEYRDEPEQPEARPAARQYWPHTSALRDTHSDRRRVAR
jgi:Na+-transporting methylmalonyl-CoA/oxaloacetate decarboxylase gamma subunit